MHAQKDGESIVVVTLTKTTTPTTPKSLNNKPHMPNCQRFVETHRCPLGHARCPNNHPDLPRLSKAEWKANNDKWKKIDKVQRSKQRANVGGNRNPLQQFVVKPYRKIVNHVCNYIILCREDLVLMGRDATFCIEFRLHLHYLSSHRSKPQWQ